MKTVVGLVFWSDDMRFLAMWRCGNDFLRLGAVSVLFLAMLAAETILNV